MKFIKRGFALSVLLCLFVAFAAHAQLDTTGKYLQKRRVPKATFKINPAAFVNFFRPALAFSSDIYITQNVVVDVGIGFYFGNIEQHNKEESFLGYRQRIGFKYVFLPDRKVAPYVGCETKFNYIVSRDIELVSRYGGQYTETMLLRHNVQNYGLALRGGIHVIPGKNRRFIMDIYSGFGYRFTHISNPKVPADAQLLTFNTEFPIDRQPGSYHLGDFLFGFNLGYCFH